MDSLNMHSNLNADAPEFHYKKETTTIEPVRRLENERFQRDERSDLNRRSPTETYVREEPPAGWRSGQPINSQYDDILNEPRDRLDSMADSLLDQRDYQELREQEQLWQQSTAAQPLSPNEYTPLIQPEVEEQKTYNTDFPAMPPQMAEYEMDNRRMQEQGHAQPNGWVDSHGVTQELPPAAPQVDYQPLVDLEPDLQEPEAPRQQLQPIRLRPLLHVMRDLCLWRNVKDSAVVFSTGLGLMMALSYFSLISIFAYLSLGVLLVAGVSVFGRQLFYALQQRHDVPHPFQRILQRDIVIDPQYMHEQLEAVLQPLNRKLVRMRNLYLADSLAETLKMGLYMYMLTYVGRYFNLMSLLILGWVMAFSVPKLYLMYRPQIDRLINMVRDNMRRVQTNIRDKFQQQKQRMQQRRDRRQSTEKKVTFQKTEKVQ